MTACRLSAFGGVSPSCCIFFTLLAGSSILRASGRLSGFPGKAASRRWLGSAGAGAGLLPAVFGGRRLRSGQSSAFPLAARIRLAFLSFVLPSLTRGLTLFGFLAVLF